MARAHLFRAKVVGLPRLQPRWPSLSYYIAKLLLASGLVCTELFGLNALFPCPPLPLENGHHPTELKVELPQKVLSLLLMQTQFPIILSWDPIFLTTLGTFYNYILICVFICLISAFPTHN